MILQLLLPKGVDQVALEVVRRVLEKRRVSALLANLGVAFTQGIQAFLFRRLDDQRIDVYRPKVY
jgi:hypothetical protein